MSTRTLDGTLDVEQIIRNREIYIVREAQSMPVDISFQACAAAVEEYAKFAFRRGWPECKLGTASWQGHRVFIECQISIPHCFDLETEEMVRTLGIFINLNESRRSS